MNNNDLFQEVFNSILLKYDLPELTKKEKEQFSPWYQAEKVYFEHQEKLPSQFDEEYREASAAKHMEEPMTGKLFDGVREVLEKCKNNGYEMFILSAKENNFLNEEIKKWSLQNYFKKVFGQDLIGRKPHVEIRKNVCNKEKVYFVGDSLYYDMFCAINNQCIPVLVNNPFPERENSDLYIDLKEKINVISSVKDLPALL